MADNLPAIREPSPPVIKARYREVRGPRSQSRSRPTAPRGSPPSPPVPRGTRENPTHIQIVPQERGGLGSLSNPQRVLFAAWTTAIGLKAFQDVRSTHDWPCPGPLLKISALYLVLGVMSEAAPNLAAWLGVGFLVAYVTRQGGAEVQRKGTFFGVPVKA